MVRGVRVEVSREEGLLRGGFIRVGVGVTSRMGQQVRGCSSVSQKDQFLRRDAVSSVVVHQAVQGAERLVPDAVLTAPLQHPEMLHPLTIAAK